MGEQTVQFPASIEVKSVEFTPIPLAETTLLEIKAPDLDKTETRNVGANTQATLYLDFTKGALTKAQFRVYGSYDGTDYYQEVWQYTLVTGVTTLPPLVIELSDATDKYAWHLAIGAYRAIKVTMQGVGAGNAGSAINATIGLKTN